MSFLKVGADGKATNRRTSKKSKKKEYPRKKDGMVYLIKMVLDCGKVIVKIGITTRRSIVERLAENVIGFFNTYRYIPRTTVKRHSRTPYYTEVEAYLHKVYEKDNHKFSKKFGGSTEYFEIEDIDGLVYGYDEVMKDPTKYITPTDKAVEARKPSKSEANKKAIYATYGLQ